MSGVTLKEFGDKMSAMLPLMIKEFARRQANELYEGKITLPQLLILDFLHRQDAAKMKVLANFMNVTTAAMTGIVGRLVAAGYVKRTYIQDDRRIIKIKLTSKGEELVKKINKQRRQMIINIFSKISDADRQEYLRIWLQIKAVIDKEKAVVK